MEYYSDIIGILSGYANLFIKIPPLVTWDSGRDFGTEVFSVGTRVLYLFREDYNLN